MLVVVVVVVVVAVVVWAKIVSAHAKKCSRMEVSVAKGR